MNADGTKRKLTAILSIDVKGYNRLKEDDEEATLRTITTSFLKYACTIHRRSFLENVFFRIGVYQVHLNRTIDSVDIDKTSVNGLLFNFICLANGDRTF